MTSSDFSAGMAVYLAFISLVLFYQTLNAPHFWGSHILHGIHKIFTGIFMVSLWAVTYWNFCNKPELVCDDKVLIMHFLYWVFSVGGYLLIDNWVEKQWRLQKKNRKCSEAL